MLISHVHYKVIGTLTFNKHELNDIESSTMTGIQKSNALTQSIRIFWASLAAQLVGQVTRSNILLASVLWTLVRNGKQID